MSESELETISSVFTYDILDGRQSVSRETLIRERLLAQARPFVFRRRSQQPQLFANGIGLEAMDTITIVLGAFVAHIAPP